MLELISKTYNDKKVVTTTKEKRHEIAVKIAEEGIVLLKNEDGILPLKDGNIIVNGYFANDPEYNGGGSARVTKGYKIPNLATTLRENMPNANVTYNGNFAYRAIDWNPTYYKNLYKESYGKDAVILCVGNDNYFEREGCDRTKIRLDKIEEDMIINLGKINENLIVLIYAGSAIDVTPWEQYAKAIVFVGYAGQGVHHALANILSGKVSPSGKLSETFPLDLNDTYCGDETGDGTSVWYNDGVFVGYRHFDRYELDVMYEFGYGLSYTDFEYKDLQVKKISELDYEVSYVIKNVGDMDAKEVSQVYIRDVLSMVVRPYKELKHFSKDFIKAGEEKKVTIKLSKRDFAFFDVNSKDWYVENGHFEILIGASSRDIRLKQKIKV
jgi:beta-glucosidase